jgi:prophage antirepressor-like protein
MNIITDIYDKLLVYNDTKINFIVDINNIVWFKFSNIANILEYKNRNDIVRDVIDKKHKKHIKDIKTEYNLTITQPDTVYINEPGLYKLLIRSRMKKAEIFQTWLIEDALPKLRTAGKFVVDDETKLKIKNLNNKIKLLTKTNKILKNNLTKNKYPSGMHFYVLKDDGMYKIGYTKDLNKRLAVYNTGKANIAKYSYYKRTDCAKQIEECMKSLLNEYIYKSDKEFYKCSLNKILKKVKECLEIENNC